MKPIPCPVDRWPEFSRLLDEAFDLPASARADWLLWLPDRHAPLKPALARVLVAAAGGDAGRL